PYMAIHFIVAAVPFQFSLSEIEARQADNDAEHKTYQSTDLHHSSSSEKMKTSSIEQWNSRANLKASFNDGSYFPVSIATIDCLETPTRFANSSCVIPCCCLSSLRRFFIFLPFGVKSYCQKFFNEKL